MGSYRVPRTVSKFLWHLSFISRGRGATQQKIGCFVIEPRFWLLADQKPIIREASFPGGASGKELTFQSKRQVRKIPPGGGNVKPLQYSCLENPMDRGAWCGLQSMGSQRVD